MHYTDFHSHILPGADHGSDNLETSLYQIEKAISANVKYIFTTPHFYVDEDTIPKFISRRERCFNELQKAIDEKGYDIKLYKSCEVNLQLGLTKIDDLEKLCIENTKYMLLELPFDTRWDKWVYHAIDELRDRKIEPILAHIDRYDDDLLEPLFDYDVLMQVNAEGMQSFFKRKNIKRYIDEGFVCFLGSDVHQYGNNYELFNNTAKKLGSKIMSDFNKNAMNLFN